MPRSLSRRNFLTSAAAGAIGLALADMRPAGAATAPLALSGQRAADSGSLIIANYATYVTDTARVNASRAEHQVYADQLREHDQLAMGGPLLGDSGRPAGVLLVYQAGSRQQAETLVQRDPFVQQGAIERYRLAEWSVIDKNVALLSAALVSEDHRTAPAATSGAQQTRLYVGYVTYVADHALVDRLRPAHESFVRTLTEQEALVMAGPFADDSGALFVYRAPSKEAAQALMQADPYYAGHVQETHALSEWRMFGLNAKLFERHEREL